MIFAGIGFFVGHLIMAICFRNFKPTPYFVIISGIMIMIGFLQ